MALWDKRQQLGTIMKRRRGSSDEPIPMSAPMKNEISMDEPGEMDGRHMAAQDMLAAMHEKSPEKMKQAMSNFIDLHMSRGDEDMPEPKE